MAVVPWTPLAAHLGGHWDSTVHLRVCWNSTVRAQPPTLQRLRKVDTGAVRHLPSSRCGHLFTSYDRASARSAPVSDRLFRPKPKMHDKGVLATDGILRRATLQEAGLSSKFNCELDVLCHMTSVLL